MMTTIVIWIALSFIAGVIAANKGRSAVGFFALSFFLSPLIGILAAAVAAPKGEKLDEEKIASGESRKCPYCAELVKRDAKVCRYCHADLAEADRQERLKAAELRMSKEESAAGTQLPEHFERNVALAVFGVMVLVGSLFAISGIARFTPEYASNIASMPAVVADVVASEIPADDESILLTVVEDNTGPAGRELDPGETMAVQSLVGVQADGAIGPKTMEAVKAWNEANGIDHPYISEYMIDTAMASM